MAITRQTTEIKRRPYRILFRTPAGDALDVPVGAAGFSTFFGTFSEAGFLQKDTLDFSGEDGDSIELDDESLLSLGVNLNLTAELIQTGDTESTDLRAIDRLSQDIMLYAEDTVTVANSKIHVFANVPISIKPKVGSNEVDSWSLSAAKANASDLNAVHIDYLQPTA